MPKLLVLHNRTAQLGHLEQPASPIDGRVSHEGPERLDAALKGTELANSAGADFERAEITTAQRLITNPALLRMVHTDRYLSSLNGAIDESREKGGIPIDLGNENFVYSGSQLAAYTAVSSVIEGIEEINRRRENVLALIRSPGHHAEPDRAMGYCLLSNAALAARYAVNQGYAERVAVVDIDIHRGNGTDLALGINENDPENFLMCDIFMQGHPVRSYPEVGQGPLPTQRENVFRCGRPFGTTGTEWVGIIGAEIIRKLEVFNPDIVIISSGFDCMSGDPNGGFEVLPKHIYSVTRLLQTLNKPILSILEGGYSLKNLEEGVGAQILALTGRALKI